MDSTSITFGLLILGGLAFLFLSVVMGASACQRSASELKKLNKLATDQSLRDANILYELQMIRLAMTPPPVTEAEPEFRGQQ